MWIGWSISCLCSLFVNNCHHFMGCTVRTGLLSKSSAHHTFVGDALTQWMRSTAVARSLVCHWATNRNSQRSTDFACVINAVIAGSFCNIDTLFSANVSGMGAAMINTKHGVSYSNIH